MRATEISVGSPRQTAAVAKVLAGELLRTKPSKKAVVIGLSGDLGTGKTTFVKAFVRGFGVRRKVISPTFILMRNFSVRGAYKRIYHVDAYRIGANDLRRLGLKDAMGNPHNIVIIEWAERVKRLLPKGSLLINIKHGRHSNERHLTFNRR